MLVMMVYLEFPVVVLPSGGVVVSSIACHPHTGLLELSDKVQRFVNQSLQTAQHVSIINSHQPLLSSVTKSSALLIKACKQLSM